MQIGLQHTARIDFHEHSFTYLINERRSARDKMNANKPRYELFV